MVQQLSQMSVTHKAIREATGVSERTIRRIQNEPPVTDTNDITNQSTKW
jgi:hypothetical protein